MYRLGKIFISDVAAGENILRNGFIPVFRENGLADHGVLFAANGTCKTTLLSFILNVFCPDQRRFVQSLQSGGDKTLEQYLIPGRPALILLDLALTLAPTLFDAAPVDHLVVGQLLYRHRSAPDKLDRTYFIARSPDLFDRLRGDWDDLLRQDQPYKSARDHLAPLIQQTTSQKEWADILEQLGLDPWLIDRQVDFARTEGGIKDTFKFRSEADFLGFFLGCVADMDAAVTLRETIDASLRKMADRPRKKRQLRAARELKGRISDFDAIARNWREAREAADAWRNRIGEAAHLLAGAEASASRSLEAREAAHGEAGAARTAAHGRMETAVANRLAVSRHRTGKEIESAEAEIRRAQGEIGDLREEEKALTAAGHLAGIRKVKAGAEIKSAALDRAGAELTPLRRKVDGLAAQYHIRLDADRNRVQEEIAGLNERREAAETARTEAEARLKDLSGRFNETDAGLKAVASRIDGAAETRKTLRLEPEETPPEAADRLDGEIASLRSRSDDIRRRTTVLEEERRTETDRWKRLQTDLSGRESDLKAARERMEEEQRMRKELLADPSLRRVGGDDFEPAGAELMSRLDDALARERDRLEEKHRERMALKSDSDRLARTRTLTVDDGTQGLIDHYLGQGLTAGELKPFPEYLAALHDDPAEIAAFIERDPGRFTGIMAADESVIEKVLALPVPDWLHRPVVVSRPCPIEEAAGIDHAVIRPKDPAVYSTRHMEGLRARLRERLDALSEEIRGIEADVKAMERASRTLHDYRKRFHDRAAVAGLAHKVRDLERAAADIAGEIAASEAGLESIGERKAELDGTGRTLAEALTQRKEWKDQVDRWLAHNADLSAWEAEKAALASRRDEMARGIEAERAEVNRLKEEIMGFKGDVRVRDARRQSLDERAGDVPRPQEDAVSDADRRAALDMDLKTIRNLCDGARDDLRRMAGELGIETLQKELADLQADLGDREERLSVFRRDNPHDEAVAEKWATRSASEREARTQILTETMGFLRDKRVQLETDLRHFRAELARLNDALAERAAQGVHPDIDDAELAGADPDGLLHRFQTEEARHREDHARLEARYRELGRKLEDLRKWHGEIQLGMAETRAYPPVWDAQSPRIDWPDPLGDDDRIGAVRIIRDRADEMITAETADRETVEETRRRMSRAFDRLHTELKGEHFGRELPAVVDALKSHDAESLGDQARDLAGRCDDIARNIESDLEISQRIMDNLIDMLIQRGREYHQKLHAAAQEKLPEDVFIYGGNPILRAGARLDFNTHADVFRTSVENWLHELIEQDRIPEVNPRVGNRLGAELLYKLLAAAAGKKEFGIRLLKCDDTGRNYEPVGKDLGSGGEALTTAVLLYALLISMRKKRCNQPDPKIPAFLVLDNPLGVCNRSDFLDAQLKVARAMGIQCVYLTGINDRESLDLFDLRVAIRKSDRQLTIDGQTLHCLEVAELNVERKNG